MQIQIDIQSTKEPRRFLFLQGPPSGFWGRLGDAVGDAGHSVVKVNFSLADRCFWGLRPAMVFRDRFSRWPATLERVIAAERITDIVYYNDGFPYHQAVSDIANACGLRAWCVEFGYLRPDWITLEPDGMNANSRFPRSAAGIKRLAQFGVMPEGKVLFSHTFTTEAISEVAFNLLQSFGWPYNPWFRSGRKTVPLLEYLGWIPHFIRSRKDRADSAALLGILECNSADYFLVAMQMEGDFQVRSSHLGGMVPFLQQVMESFSSSAPADAYLIIKAHPLESGLRNWGVLVARMAKDNNLEGRVHYLRGGNLQALLSHIKGLVVLNSTTGIHGLLAGTPIMALGNPVYKSGNLVHLAGLNNFWHEQNRPKNRELLAFLKALSTIQIKGSFYNKDGQTSAISQMVERLTQEGPTAVHNLLSEIAAKK